MTDDRSYIILISFFIILFVNGCASRTAPAPVVNIGEKSSKKVIKNKQITSKYYIVKKGDTLYSIAFSSGRDFRDIARINKISKPYSIYPGQRLSLYTSKSRQNESVTKTYKKKAKSESNQTVDRQNKTAYGNYVKNGASTSTSPFPSQVNKWQWPNKGRIINKFSLSPEGNKGVDISGNKGSPVLAAADGKIVYTGDALRGYGKLIIVKHSESYLSAYAHNDKIIVKEQQWVKAGQRIAHMGNTGTDKTMLHFEIRYKGKSVDPLRYLPKK